MAVDSDGNVYVADSGSTIRKITTSGTTTTIAGMVGVKGIILGTPPQFAFPGSLATIGDSIVISDSHAILVLRPSAH
jgi:hypothetical protein